MAHRGAVVAVGVVFDRAASVIVDGLERAGHGHLEAEAEKVWHVLFGLVGREALGQLDGAGVADDVREVELAADGLRHVVVRLDGHLPVLAGGLESGELQVRVAPGGVAVLQACAEVVVGRGTPEVGRQGLALLDEVASVDGVLDEASVVAVELQTEVPALDDEVVAVVVLHDGCGHGGVDELEVAQLEGGRGVGFDDELVVGGDVAGWQKTVGGLEAVADVEEPLARGAGVAQVERQARGSLRGAVEPVDAAGAHGLSVARQGPLHVVAREVAEEVLVVEANLAARAVGPVGPDVLVEVGHLRHVRVGSAVGADETVVVEVVVAGVEAVEVATVSVDGHAAFAFPADALIDEVPDKAALILGILADEVPVLLEAAHGVAHGVGVLALDEGLGLRVIAAVLLAVVGSGVHGAVDVGLAVVAGAFVLYGPTGVLGLDPVVSSFEVRPVAGLVAQAPEDDARVVEVAFYVALVAFEMSFQEIVAARQGGVAVTHAVALKVGFGDDVKPVAVAELVPIGVVGVVASAHGVEVVRFHDLDVLFHALARYDITAVGVHLVAVSAFEEYGLAVDEYLGILEFNFAETHFDGDDFEGAVAVPEGGSEGVEVGRLGTPFVWSLHLKGGLGSAGGFECMRSHRAPFGVGKDEVDEGAARRREAHVEAPVAVLGVEVGRGAQVGDVLLAAGIEIAVTAYAAEAEKVLVLEVGAVRPAEHLEGDDVCLAGLKVGREVELGLELAVLAVAHVAAVDPQVHVRRDGAEVGDDLAPLPRGGHGDGAAVRADVIFRHGHVGRVVAELLAPGIAHVDVDGVAVAVELPHAGHGDGVPAPVVEVRAPEVGGPGVGMAHPEEFPHAVERHEVFGLLLDAARGHIGRLVGEEARVHRRAVDGVHPGVVPLGERLRPRREGRQGHEARDGQLFYHWLKR